MAEIKSTMELVMERLARMDLDAIPDTGADQEQEHAGMRQGAAFVQGQETELATIIDQQPEAGRQAFQRGVVQALLRNIVTPKEESQKESGQRALAGLAMVSRGSGDLMAMFSDISNILDRYLDHRNQMRQQLEQAFAQQMGQMEESLARQTGMQMKLQPSQHPKFQEEWQRLEGDLDEQYGRALEQYKEQIGMRLAGRS